MRTKLSSALFFIASCALSTGASAHIGPQNHAHASFMTGLLHPWYGADHLLAMLAVGAWTALAAKQVGRSLLRAPLAFANLLLLGALLGLQGLDSPAVEPMVAASVLVLGLLIAARHALGGTVSLALAGSFALFHGLAHGAELATAPDPVLAIAGMTVSTLALQAIGLGLGWVLRGTPWARRLTGSALASSGLGLLLQLG